VERPSVRVNQLGYLPDGPKRAVWVTDAVAPAAFRVLDRGGGAVAGGATVPWAARPEPTSGLRVHELDFSGVRTEGEGFVVEAGGARSHPFAIAADLYAPLRDDALRFFYLQRSGVAIDDARAPGYGRPAGHAGDGCVGAWSGPDARRLYPGWSCPGRFDASGGWYDAGDHGKYVTSGAMPVWQLLATIEHLRRRGTDPAGTEALLAEECRWQLDWLLRMQVPPGLMHAGSPSTGSTAPSGRRSPAVRTRTRRPACSTALRPPPGSTWPQRRRTGRECSPATPPTRGGCSTRRRRPTAPRRPNRS
jgi:endoglucanase